jgi:hypothetical protein
MSYRIEIAQYGYRQFFSLLCLRRIVYGNQISQQKNAEEGVWLIIKGGQTGQTGP